MVSLIAGRVVPEVPAVARTPGSGRLQELPKVKSSENF